ncbi:hypothetical protein N665_0162s0003 [Sinapis alba]|nr:hypothetical protein N665_0162s0003 [Sinapis alba]
MILCWSSYKLVLARLLVLIDTGSSVDLIFHQTLIKMVVDLKDIKPSSRVLTSFNGSSTQLLGTIRLNVFVGGMSKLVKFNVIDTKTQYNTIMGTPWLHMMKAVPSTYHRDAVGAERVRIGPRKGQRVEVGGNRIYVEQVQGDSTGESDNESQASQHSRYHNRRQPAADNLGNLKLRIPPFHGKNDPDAYMEWEKKIELVFNSQQYNEEREADVNEDDEATMARFQGGLNRDIQDRLEFQEYENMDELLHKAILIEQQNKRKSASKTQYGFASKSAYSKDDKSSTKPKEESSSLEARLDDKDKGPATAIRSRNVKCFKCQGFGHYANECTNKKVIKVLANGDVVSEDEKTDQDLMMNAWSTRSKEKC